MDRSYIDAVIMGLAVGLGAILLEAQAGSLGWPLQFTALLLIGTILCAAQYGLIRLRRRK
ncbi:MAG: hypothetical protein WCF99_13420 [Chloroflexales bacterium]